MMENQQPTLNPQDVRELKSKLYNLKPAVIINNNELTNEVIHNIDEALNESELIKIRTHARSSEELTKIANQICAEAKAVLVQSLGYIIAIYKKNLVIEE